MSRTLRETAEIITLRWGIELNMPSNPEYTANRLSPYLRHDKYISEGLTLLYILRSWHDQHWGRWSTQNEDAAAAIADEELQCHR